MQRYTCRHVNKSIQLLQYRDTPVDMFIMVFSSTNEKSVHMSTVYTRVYISVWKRYLSPPPLRKMIFFPLSPHVVFWLPSWPFCLNSSLFWNYFTLLLPLFSFSFPFLPFSLTFSPFSYFFPQIKSADIPPRGGGIFQYIGPCVHMFKMTFSSLSANIDLWICL